MLNTLTYDCGLLHHYDQSAILCGIRLAVCRVGHALSLTYEMAHNVMSICNQHYYASVNIDQESNFSTIFNNSLNAALKPRLCLLSR